MCIVLWFIVIVCVFATVHQGYGDDSDKTLDAFPFSQPTVKDKDEDAELRRQLRGMGKGSVLSFTY